MVRRVVAKRPRARNVRRGQGGPILAGVRRREVGVLGRAGRPAPADSAPSRLVSGSSRGLSPCLSSPHKRRQTSADACNLYRFLRPDVALLPQVAVRKVPSHRRLRRHRGRMARAALPAHPPLLAPSLKPDARERARAPPGSAQATSGSACPRSRATRTRSRASPGARAARSWRRAVRAQAAAVPDTVAFTLARVPPRRGSQDTSTRAEYTGRPILQAATRACGSGRCSPTETSSVPLFSRRALERRKRPPSHLHKRAAVRVSRPLLSPLPPPSSGALPGREGARVAPGGGAVGFLQLRRHAEGLGARR